VLDHVSVPVSEGERSKRFYVEALSPLGYELYMEHSISGVAFGQPGTQTSESETLCPMLTNRYRRRPPQHREYLPREGYRGGQRDNGRPGLRPKYHPSCFGGYVLDPDGNNIEVICHRPGK
jgi:catechol 2,3-dioxygenase-like lactoylglutathione lyase family enzyme